MKHLYLIKKKEI